jgi:integrase
MPSPIRPTTSQRGYGVAHDRTGSYWEPLVRNRLALAMLLDLGLRKAELGGIMVRDLDLARRTVVASRLSTRAAGGQSPHRPSRTRGDRRGGRRDSGG